MVVRDTSMANLTCVDTLGAMMVQTADEVQTDDAVAMLPSSSSESSHPLKGPEGTSEAIEKYNQSLKVLTSMHSSHLVGSRVDSRRSEDDDGYCSRSSLDSPVQIMKHDIISGTEESESFDLMLNPASKSGEQLVHTSSCGQPTAEIDCLSGKEPINERESDSETARMTHNTAVVASLDHSYLLVDSTGTNVPSANAPVTSSASIGSASEQMENSSISDKPSIQPLATILGGINKSLSSNRRNFSVYVVPRGIRSVGATNQCEARLVQVTPVVSSRSLEASASRWNTRTGTYGELRKDSSKIVVKNEFANGAAERPVSLLWHPTDNHTVTNATVQDNSMCGESFVASLKTSLAHRPDQYKPGISTGRCRIGLSEISKRLNPVGFGSIAQQKGATSARTGSMYVRAPQASRGTLSNSSSTRTVSRIAEAALRLHPLVDHDYGAFATFNAEIQSSIISTTTDGASQMDWRSMRKNRLGRVKHYRVETAVVSASAADQSSPPRSTSETPQTMFQVRQKRKYCRKQPVNREAVVVGIPKLSKNTKVPGRKGRPPLSDSRRLSMAKKRSAVHDVSGATNSSSQSFVKIPGHYQNEFVYYATKRTRGRPRKQVDGNSSLQPVESSSAAIVKQPSSTGASGINVFDWYREMAQTDKSSRFGTTVSSMSSPLPSTVHWTSSDNGTPADESAVADLVMEMLPKSELVMGKDFPPMSGVEVFSTNSNGFAITNDRSEMTVTEEDVCAAMLQSLNEADLKMIETQLGVTSDAGNHRGASLDGGEKVLPSISGDSTFTQYLQEYGRDGLLSLSQMSAPSNSNVLLDVDDINDSDLLTADLGNMNVLLSDLSTPTRDVRISNAPVVSRSNLSALFGISSVSSAEPALPKEVNANVPVTSPPELTTVNMFWNDVPGLLINGLEYVRLVDIHRQMLPAKDTGILKKRCQMLMLDVLQCSELQRDFLIRYMNAAKSKSTAIVSRQNAIGLIGFYVNPKQKVPRSDDNYMGTDEKHINNICKEKHVSAQSMPCDKTGNVTDNCVKLQKLKTTSSDLSTAPEESLNNTKHPTDTVSPRDSLTGIKRSERLRDKHVRYADMVLGIHHRRGVEADEDVLESQLSRGNAESMDAEPLRDKLRHSSGDLKVCETVESNRGRTTSDSTKLTPPSVQHSHRTRLASSSDRSAKPVCELDNEVVQPQMLQFNQNNNIVSSLPNSVPVDKCDVIASVAPKSDYRRSALQQRINRAFGHRRRGGVNSLRRRINLKEINVVEGVQHSLTSVHETSKACDDFKENLDAKGIVADNADIHRLTKDTVRVPENEASSNVAVDQMVASESSCIVVDVVQCEPCQIEDQTEVHERLCPSVAIKTEASHYAHWPHDNLVQVRHCDVVSRLGRRRRSQNGCILLDRFTWKGAKCVRCDSCSKLFTTSSFVSHMHRWSGSDELVPVSALQRLEPRGTNCDGWQVLERLQASFVDELSVKSCEIGKRDELVSRLQQISDARSDNLVSEEVSTLDKLKSVPQCRLTHAVESKYHQELLETSHDRVDGSLTQHNTLLNCGEGSVKSEICHTLPCVTSLALIRSKRSFPLIDVKQDVRGHLRHNFRRRSPGGARTARK